MTDLGSTVNARYVYSKFSCHLCSSLGNPAPVTKQARMAMATMLIGSLEWSCSYPLIWESALWPVCVVGKYQD